MAIWGDMCSYCFSISLLTDLIVIARCAFKYFAPFFYFLANPKHNLISPDVINK